MQDRSAGFPHPSRSQQHPIPQRTKYRVSNTTTSYQYPIPARAHAHSPAAPHHATTHCIGRYQSASSDWPSSCRAARTTQGCAALWSSASGVASGTKLSVGRGAAGTWRGVSMLVAICAPAQKTRAVASASDEALLGVPRSMRGVGGDRTGRASLRGSERTDAGALARRTTAVAQPQQAVPLRRAHGGTVLGQVRRRARGR
ncbi:hypothetical protein PsYK624_100500 [Phanerochaete sordida]|uniref:Uncharacterized protein n=1 Tax=Phanerochaete sordida TaxID=48140 RepID=A0A9P3GHQ5_9APHY|nr:hypothetical protein PsYK624_100500 [Phanerochaete sordida]